MNYGYKVTLSIDVDAESEEKSYDELEMYLNRIHDLSISTPVHLRVIHISDDKEEAENESSRIACDMGEE